MMEFESWLLAGIETLRKVPLSGGRGVVPSDATAPDFDVENKRDAKGLMRTLVPGYDPSLDQAVLSQNVDLAAVARRCNSFRRFQSAIAQLADAARKGQMIVSPIIL
jgi:hypothetical protein